MAQVKTMRRKAKNVAYNYSDAQVKVREATSNDPWGPPSSLMSEIADLTHNAMAFTEIMQLVWKRLNDHGKNWRHVYKSMVLLDYLIKTGSEKVAQQCKENIYTIETLKDFEHIEENKDQGMNVREKAKQMVQLLKDDERLKNERTRALVAKRRFQQNNVGIASDGSRQHSRSLNRQESELEEARPASAGEEDLQLQIAIALSREEAQQSEEARRGDDIRLQMALDESKHEPPVAAAAAAAAAAPPPSSTSQSAIDDLLSLQPIATGGASLPPTYNQATRTVDPWAPTDAAAAAWMNAPAKQNDPWAPQSDVRTSDPWAPSTFSPTEPVAAVGVHNGIGVDSNGGAWDLGELETSLPTSGAAVSGNRPHLKTPETFLGENSALVNLENLMGPSKPVGQGAAAPANPFLAGPPTAENPFAAQQRPSPTLNQMRTQMVGSASSDGDGDGGVWGMAAALQPTRPGSVPASAAARTASTNPFL